MWKPPPGSRHLGARSAGGVFPPRVCRGRASLARGRGRCGLVAGRADSGGGGPALEMDRRAPSISPASTIPDALVTPGFVDGHTHFAMWALARRQVQLAGARDPGLRRWRGSPPARPRRAGWSGHGWDANGWAEPPDRHALDLVHASPVYLDSLDVHAAWVNSAALAVARVTRETPDPPGGRIVRDGRGADGAAAGAGGGAGRRRSAPAPSAEMLDDAMREAQAEAHRLGRHWHPRRRGRAGLGDPSAGWRKPGSSGSGCCFIPRSRRFPTWSAGRAKRDRLAMARHGRREAVSRRQPRQPHRVDAGAVRAKPGPGMPVTGEAEAADAMRLAAANGIAVTVHAIGDAAVRRALDLLEELPRAALPHRIEHFQCVHPADLAPGGPGRRRRVDAARASADRHPAGGSSLGRARARRLRLSLAAAGGAPRWCSAATCRSPRSTPAKACTPRWSGRGSTARRRAGWRPEEKIGFEDVVRDTRVAAAHASGTSRRLGRSRPAPRRTWWRGRWTRRRSGAMARPSVRDARYSPWSAGGRDASVNGRR